MIAQNVNHTGKFFGEYQGDVMSAMVEKNYFQAIDVFDYQALCRIDVDDSSDAQSLLHVSEIYIHTYIYIPTMFCLIYPLCAAN